MNEGRRRRARPNVSSVRGLRVRVTSLALRLLGLGANFMLGKVEDPETGAQNWRIDDARWGEYGALAGGAVGFVLALV